MTDLMQDKLWSRVITAFAKEQMVDLPNRCEWDMEELAAVAIENNGTMEGVTKFLGGLEEEYLVGICVGDEIEADRILAHAKEQARAVHAILDKIYDDWGDHTDE
jgi:hypothetical protein